jgi:hypothetical protein
MLSHLRGVFVTIAVLTGSWLGVARADVTATPFGSASFTANPTWKPTDFHFFNARIGDNNNNFADFPAEQQKLFPPPGYGFDPNHNGIVPGSQPVPGPYDTRMAQALAANGIVDQSTFTAEQFQIPNGVYLTWVNVPTASAPTGSSPDFASGPIVPNSIFPINFGGQTLRDGVLFDPNWSGTTSPTTALSLTNPGQGWSHFPTFTAETHDFGEDTSVPVEGNYVHQFTLTDAAGNGWNITAPFTVVTPEPGLGLLVLPAAVLLRRPRGNVI